MRHLKTYRLFESSVSGLTQEQEAFLNKHTKGSWRYNPTTGLVDVEGDFKFSSENLVDMYGIKFGKVSGNFNCSWNKLTSLKGAPQEVGGGFYCHYSKLTSLEGAPQKVGVDFDCSYNRLTSLEGAPQKVSSNFSCIGNKLTSLKGAPQEVGGMFHCSENKLTSLEGAPQEVGGGFDCSYNKLTSLKGAPQKVGGRFYCGSFELGPGKWNLEGWLGILKKGKPKAQSLILTFIPPEAINKEIQKDPAGMIMKLKGFWNSPDFESTRAKLVWPQGYEEQMDIVGGLNTIGF